MSIPSGVIKLVFSGLLQGGEVFAHSFWFDYGSVPNQGQLDAQLGGATAAFNTDLGTTAVKALFPTTTSYKTITAYSYAGASHADRVSGPNPVSTWVGTGSNALPNQCATVLSLRTGIPGRSFRGRAYLPGVAQGALASTGQIGSSSITTLGGAWLAWLQAMNSTGAGFTAMPPSVVSATRSSLSHVTFFDIDSRVDVQRRRAAKQVVTTVTNFTL